MVRMSCVALLALVVPAHADVKTAFYSDVITATFSDKFCGTRNLARRAEARAAHAGVDLSQTTVDMLNYAQFAIINDVANAGGLVPFCKMVLRGRNGFVPR